MAEETDAKKIGLEQLMVSTVAMTDALAKLLIANGFIMDEEFKAQLRQFARERLAGLRSADLSEPRRGKAGCLLLPENTMTIMGSCS